MKKSKASALTSGLLMRHGEAASTPPGGDANPRDVIALQEELVARLASQINPAFCDEECAMAEAEQDRPKAASNDEQDDLFAAPDAGPPRREVVEFGPDARAGVAVSWRSVPTMAVTPMTTLDRPTAKAGEPTARQDTDNTEAGARIDARQPPSLGNTGQGAPALRPTGEREQISLRSMLLSAAVIGTVIGGAVAGGLWLTGSDRAELGVQGDGARGPESDAVEGALGLSSGPADRTAAAAVRPPDGDQIAVPSRADPVEVAPLAPAAPRPARDVGAGLAAPNATASSPNAGPTIGAVATTQAAPTAHPASYTVQLLSTPSQDAAEAEWQRLSAKFASLLGDEPHIIVAADLGSRGVYYRVRVGPFGSDGEARQLCKALKAKRQDCLVVKD